MNFIKKISAVNWIKIAVIVLILIGAIVYVSQKKEASKVDDTKNIIVATTTPTKTVTKTTIKKVPTAVSNVMNKCNFKVVSPTMYSKISFPFVITGILDKADTTEGCTWNEASSIAGNAEIFYNKDGLGWKSAGTPVAINTKGTPGMSSSTLSFEVLLNLYTSALGLKSGTPIKIVFSEFNPSKLPNPDTFDFQVVLK